MQIKKASRNSGSFPLVLINLIDVLQRQNNTTLYPKIQATNIHIFLSIRNFYHFILQNLLIVIYQ